MNKHVVLPLKSYRDNVQSGLPCVLTNHFPSDSFTLSMISSACLRHINISLLVKLWSFVGSSFINSAAVRALHIQQGVSSNMMLDSRSW